MAKKLSNNSIDKIIKAATKTNVEIPIGCGDDDKPASFEVSWATDISKRMQSIMDGVSLAWDEVGDFLPAISSLSYAYALLSCFTNIKMEKVEKIYALTQLTSVVEVVEKALPVRVFEDFKHDFNECFEFYKTRNNRLNNVDTLCGSLEELVLRFGNVIDNTTPETVGSLLNTEPEPKLSLVDKDE